MISTGRITVTKDKLHAHSLLIMDYHISGYS